MVHLDQETCSISIKPERRRLLTLVPTAEGPAEITETPSGILLPPGVSEKLSARAAIAEAEALVDSLPVRREQDVEQRLLAEVDRLSRRVQQLEAMLATTETKVEEAEAQAAEPAPVQHPEAVELLAQEPLFLDYETTGLKKTDAVVEVAVLDTAGRVLFSTLVNPERPINPDISAINGITDEMVADAPTWDQIAPHLQQLLEGRVVVAHNSKFEAKFTPQDWNLTWVCSKELADRALGKSRWWGGGGLAARLQQAGLLPGPVHSAAGDCLSCLRLVKHLAGDRSPVELVYQN